MAFSVAFSVASTWSSVKLSLHREQKCSVKSLTRLSTALIFPFWWTVMHSLILHLRFFCIRGCKLAPVQILDSSNKISLHGNKLCISSALYFRLFLFYSYGDSVALLAHSISYNIYLEFFLQLFTFHKISNAINKCHHLCPASGSVLLCRLCARHF